MDDDGLHASRGAASTAELHTQHPGLPLHWLAGDALPQPCAGRLVVNLGQAVVEAVREARYLDRLGFAVPDVTLHAALQAGRLRAAAEGLAAMLAAYYKARCCCTSQDSLQTKYRN